MEILHKQVNSQKVNSSRGKKKDSRFNRWLDANEEDNHNEDRVRSIENISEGKIVKGQTKSTNFKPNIMEKSVDSCFESM